MEDDLSKAVREVNELFQDNGKQVTLSSKQDVALKKNVLFVQQRYLNPTNELKKIFGSRVLQAEQNKRKSHRGSRLLKSTCLVTAKDTWPPVGKLGLCMNIAPTPNDLQPQNSGSSSSLYFVFEHKPSYRQQQEKFLAAVESMNSDDIIAIINQQPYHIDSLIQLSELCKMTEDYGMASELIEHALFALETSFHPMFSVTNGTSRLDYKYQENRALFIVLFKHSLYLESKACTRTALEVAKFLLSLDPEHDPLAVILLLDFYAIRAKQYDWLIQLFEEWEKSHNLTQLPNFAFSRALALFYLDRIEEADEALQYALLMFPAVMYLLIQELKIQTDSRIMTHSYFQASCYRQQRLPLQQLTSLYVSRAKTIWKDPIVLPFLERNVNVVLDKIDLDAAITNEFTDKRNSLYNITPRPILRHIILSDFKERVPLAQALPKGESILMYDPLPPLDSINAYKRYVFLSSFLYPCNT